MKYFTLLYNSFLISLSLALICFKSEWLEMRIDIGLILFVSWIVLFLAFILFTRNKKFEKSFLYSIINLGICFVLSLVLYGVKRLAIVPASIIREGLNITSVSFQIINICVCLFIILGGIFIFIKNRKITR